MKNFLFSLIPLLGLIVFQPVNAQQIPASNSPETNTNNSSKKKCQLPQKTYTPTQQSPINGNTTFGRIYDVVGDIVMVELDDGSTKHLGVRRSEAGYMRSLIGSRIACNIPKA